MQMKRLFQTLAVIALSTALAAPALANCSFNGRSYPAGTVVGDRVCGADGRWQQR
jgi:hypothetical protein